MMCADSRTLGVYAYLTISLEDVFSGKEVTINIFRAWSIYPTLFYLTILLHREALSSVISK